MNSVKVGEDQAANLVPWPEMLIDGLPAWIWEIQQQKKAEALERLARERTASANKKRSKANAK